MQQLSQKDIDDLKREGFSEQEINEALREIQVEESMGKGKQYYDPRSYAQNSAFAPMQQENLIKWQLELDNILERSEHILRGDRLVFVNGSLIWQPNPNPNENILNEYGVAEVMRVLSMYLNRNTILSDYDEEIINEKVLDFGRELNDLFFMKYEEMGLSISFEQAFQKIFNSEDKILFGSEGVQVAVRSGTQYQFLLLSPDHVQQIELYKEKLSLEKRKNYPMLIREIVDTVHSAYLRAKHGGERRSLREARSIVQNEQISGMGGLTINTGGMQTQTRGVLNPFRYIIGKNK